jgi:Integral membrane protein TerC family
MIDAAGWLFLLIQIFFVDLLLGADNTVVIALACRPLPPEHTRRAILLGAIGAIALRLRKSISPPSRRARRGGASVCASAPSGCISSRR